MIRAARAALALCLMASAAGASAAARVPATLHTLDGEPVELQADGAVLLQFWASWCSSCGGLLWDLDRLAAGYPALAYLAVSIDAQREDARAITNHPVYTRVPRRFAHDSDGALQRRFDIRVSPSLLLLGPDGEVAFRHVGHVNSEDLQRLKAALDRI